ncbi:DUF1672 family protein, partial [Bacillaceae bacterium Marseille-Q3522]|nr:DUF1672 family protein [Bacillaceae bacterium Marseille-Q3522]
MDNTNIDEIIQGNGKNQTVPKEQKTEDYLVRVQDYTGEGYELRNGEETDKIAKAHRLEIEKAVKDFFLEKYKTEVTVHNVVGAIDGATVFVESVGEPHFYTYAIVPINAEKKKVYINNVWTEEGQVEDCISGGIYAMIFEEELKKLDQYLQTLVSEYPIVGSRIEAIQNVGAVGYSTEFYYITTYDDNLIKLSDLYLQYPTRTKEEWKNSFNKNSFEPDGVIIAINLHMKESEAKPDKVIF